MALAIMYKGSDEVIVITVTSDGTSPIDLNTVEDITVSAFQNKEDIVQQWKLSDGDVTITDASNGVCKVNLDRKNSATLPEKRIYIEVDLTLVNSDFEDDISIEKDTKPLCDLKNSVT